MTLLLIDLDAPNTNNGTPLRDGGQIVNDAIAFINANLNPDKFGGTGAGITIATGFARTTTALRLYLPLSFLTNSTSLTITSTFEIFTPDFASVATGISIGDFTLGDAGNKIAGVEIATTGLIAKDAYILRTETATSEILVNN